MKDVRVVQKLHVLTFIMGEKKMINEMIFIFFNFFLRGGGVYFF